VAATCDIVSGGRVEMCVGAGWDDGEWTAYGYGFPPARERLGMLEEGVEIMRQAWTDGVATLAGTHYQVDGAIVRPLPLQPGGIPLWIAGGGEKKTLRLAARYAQYTNFDGSPDTFAHKSAVLAEHCTDLGRDFDSIVRSANYNVVIGRDQAEVDERIAGIEARYAQVLPPEDARRRAAELRGGPLVGTPDQLIGALTGLESLGMTYAITYFAEAAHDTSGIELFVKEVVPALG